MKLKPDASPYANFSSRSQFEELFDGDNRMYDVPRKFFEFKQDGTVYLDSEVASKLDWHIDEVYDQKYNIACSGSRITVNGELLNVNPGFWCSFVRKDDVID